MTQEELQKIIEQLDEPHLETQGVFGIFQFGGGTDESYIRANKEGMQLFALELLKSARATPQTLASNEKTIPLHAEKDWIDQGSDTLIHYIEPIADRQIAPLRQEHKSTFFDKLIPVGCISLFLILVIATIVGLGTMFTWLF